MAAMLASCMHPQAYVSALFTPVHALADCGAFQRRSPTGGAANGIPLYEKIPPCSTPLIVPSVTLTVVVRGAELHVTAKKIETINTKKQYVCFDRIASPYD
jgi:hypothetical protein